jgi:hypothetical protein
MILVQQKDFLFGKKMEKKRKLPTGELTERSTKKSKKKATKSAVVPAIVPPIPNVSGAATFLNVAGSSTSAVSEPSTTRPVQKLSKADTLVLARMQFDRL